MVSQGNAPNGLTGVLDSATRLAGSRWTATIVTVAVAVFFVVGAVAGFEHWWVEVLHATAAIVTLPMLFVLQHTTNRQTTAILIKLDEIVRATDAEEEVIDLEDHEVSDQEDLHDELHH